MSVDKFQRQALIRRILAEEVIESQEALRNRLKAEGISVTQATISRDLGELGVVRVPIGRGRTRYVIPETLPGRPTPDQIHTVLRRFVLDIRGTQNLILLKTTPSAAPVVADLLDRLEWPELLGTISGEDTVLAVVQSSRQRKAVMMRIEQWRMRKVED